NGLERLESAGARTSVERPTVVAGALEEPVHVLLPAGMVYLRRGFRTASDGGFDVVVHFHGGSKFVEPAFDQGSVDAALLTVNLGIGSGKYEDLYQDASALGRALGAVQGVVLRSGVAASPRVRRVALSAWSAGYGAVARILVNDAEADRVDAVL